MRKFEKSVIINAPAEKVYDYVTRPENLPAIWPSLIEVKDVERERDGSHSFDWTYKMAGIPVHGHSETVEVEQNRRIVVKNERGIPSRFEYLYEPQDGGMKLTMKVEYQLPNKVLEKLAEPLLAKSNEREAETLLNNLKEVMEFAQKRAA